MKPVDSTEGEEREGTDLDAPSPDGFTILDSGKSAGTDEQDKADDRDSGTDSAEIGAADQPNAETEEPPTDTADNNDAAASADDTAQDDDTPSADATAQDDDAENNTNGDGSADNDDELSFDEWLAAAESEQEETTNDGAGAAKSNRSGATKKARARKVKNRRTRRSRAKPEDADDTESSISETESPSAASDSDETTAQASTATGDSISDIMAELLAAAEQSSLERDDGDEVTDTEVELDPEDVSEFAGEAEIDPKDEAAEDTNKKSSGKKTADNKPSDTKPEADKSTSPKGDTEPEETTTDDTKTPNDKKASGDTKKSADKTTPDGTTTSADKETSGATKTPADKTTAGDTKSPTDKKTSGDKEASDTSAEAKPKTDAKEASGEEKPSDGAKTAQVTVAAAQSPVEPKTAGPILTPLRRPEKQSRIPTAVIATVAAVVGLYAILVAGWAIDTVTHRGEAMRGVRMAGVAVGGSGEERLKQVIIDLDADLGGRETTVTIDDIEIVSNPVSLGLHHDGEPMIDQALEARRGGFIAFRPIRWLFHLFSTENVPAQYAMDASVADGAVEDIIRPELSVPVEPEMELQGSQMEVVPGAIGVTVDAQEIVEQLPVAIDGGQPYEIELTALDARPSLTDDAVAEVVADINEQTEQPILAQVLDQQVEVSPRTLKSWMTLATDGDEPEWTIDEEAALEDLKPLFPALGSEDQQARFSVVDGEPIIIPASETVICCESITLSNLATAISRPIPALIEPPEDADEDEEPVQPLRQARLEPAITGQDEGVAELESLGVIEEVSTFTTPHACCQNRVINIQRFADLMQGVIIRPGEEFSLNEFVGRRTRENGFVADGAIVLGNFEPQVGGGISQYATTFFNAAFFAGIEFLEYQSHSIYISRYPRGREATISWRRPDLKVLNNTDYGILVWNEYTDTSITVTFYSTKHREVEALPLRRSSDRQCRIDITPRVITFPDGSTAEDSVFALYRPGQGLDCNGNSTTPEEDEAEQANNTPEPPPDPDPEPDPDPDDDDEILPPGG